MNKFHGIGLVVLLAVTFALVESAEGTLFTNQVGSGSGSFSIFELAYSTIDAVTSRFGETFFESSTKITHVVWWDDTTPDDIVFYSSTTDGLTKTTPFTIYTGGGGGFPSVNLVEVFASGQNVFVSWLIEEDPTFCTGTNCFSLFLRFSADGGTTFSAYGSQAVVFANATGVSSGDMEMVGNSLNDVTIVYRNDTSDSFEAYVSHDNGVSWGARQTIGGITHGLGNDHSFNKIGDHSITMQGNEIEIAYGGNYTAGACSGGCETVLFQRSADAGDTWLTNPTLLTAESRVTLGEPFIFSSGSIINILYHDFFGSANMEQARSINDGTSFTTQINTGLNTSNCSFGSALSEYERWIAIGSGSSLGIFCQGSTPILNFITSIDSGSAWSSVDSINTSGVVPDNFQGYTNGTVSVVTYLLSGAGSPRQVALSDNTFTNWYKVGDRFTNDELFVRDGSAGITDDRVIITTASNTGTDETRSISFEFPICFNDQDFNCPLNLSQVVNTSTDPTKIQGIITSTGYASIWENSTGTDHRLFFAKTDDGAVTGSTPIDISGTTTTSGVNEDQLFVFENATTGNYDVFWGEIDPLVQDNTDWFHSRSIDSGASFDVKTQVVTNAGGIFPMVNGDIIEIFFVDSNFPKFKRSVNGGSSFTSDVFVGNLDQCEVPDPPLRAINDPNNSNIYVAWQGQNQTSLTEGICFNRSTNDGSTFGTTQNLEDLSTSLQNDFTVEFELFSSGSSITAIWQNANADELKQARSTNSGASFGVEEDALDTLGIDSVCTDPFPLADSFNTGSRIYIACSGSPNGLYVKNSTNMGLTYSSIAEITGETTQFVDEIKGTADGSNVFIAYREITITTAKPNADNKFIFSNDSGLTWDTSESMFMNLFNFGADFGRMPVNSTHVYLGFDHQSSFDLGQNSWVSLNVISAPPLPPDTPPVITITGDNPVQHLINTTYTDAGAVCNDAEDGSLTSSIVTIENVNTTVLGTGTVTYTCTDSDANIVQAIRTVNVVAQITTTTTTGGAVGAPVSGTVDTGIEGLTPEQILAFDQAVADAIASIEPSEGNIIETIIQTFFEFIVVDKVHEDLQLQSFLDDQRLGFRWSTGDDLIIISATPALSPFMFTFEQFPVVRQGSGAFVSTNFILYNLEVPRTECTVTISVNCVEKIRYEIPVTVNAIINGTQVSDTGTITVDLTEDQIDPILLIILSTAVIPFIAVIIQRSRGRSTIQPLRRVIS